MHTFAPSLSCTVSLWAELTKANSDQCSLWLPRSTEPAAYPRVASSKSHTFSMESTKKARINSQSRPHQLPLVCPGRSHGEDLTNTQAIQIPVKWLEAENCTCSDPFRQDLSLRNKLFSWADHTMSSERSAFLHTFEGRCIFSAHFNFGCTAPEHSYGRSSPTALNNFIFLL